MRDEHIFSSVFFVVVQRQVRTDATNILALHSQNSFETLEEKEENATKAFLNFSELLQCSAFNTINPMRFCKLVSFDWLFSMSKMLLHSKSLNLYQFVLANCLKESLVLDITI